MIMFNKKQYGVLAILFGVNLAFALAISTLGGSMGTRGPTGNTGPQGPQGSTGPVGETGVDGREVEFSVEDNILVWRYVGDTTWIELDMEISGGNSTITTGGSGYFSDWVFSHNLQLANPVYPSADLTNQTAYVAAKIAEGYTEIDSLAALASINNDVTGNYVLSTDITLTEAVSGSDTYFISSYFSGILDGAGYTLSAFSVELGDAGSIYDGGLFNGLEGNAKILNLNLEDFTFSSNGEVEDVGAIASSAEEDSNITIDNVHLNNFTVAGGNRTQGSGGFIGEANYSSNVTITNSSATNVNFKSNQYLERLGGLVGSIFENATVVIDNVETSVFIDSITSLEGLYDVEEVGGLIGLSDYYSAMIVSDAEVTLEGYGTRSVGGLVGRIDEDSTSVFVDTDSTISIDSLPGQYSSAIGGLIGNQNSYSMILADGVTTRGDINTDEIAGGLIGYVSEDTTFSLNNINTDVRIEGENQLGGIIGYTEGYYNRHMIKNFEVSGDIVGLGYDGANNEFRLANAGGVYGEIDDSDGDDMESNSQYWIDNGVITSSFELIENETIEEAGTEVYVVAGLSDVAGVIGASGSENALRLTNLEVISDFTFEISNQTKFSYIEMNFIGIAGFIGDADDNNITTLNSSYMGDISISFKDSSNGDSVGVVAFNISEVAGAIGQFNEGQWVAAGIDINANYDFNLTDVETTNHEFDIEIYEIGGLVGYAEGMIFAIDINITSLFNIHFVPENSAPSLDLQVFYDFYQIGQLIGDFDSGLAFIDNVTWDVDFVINLLEEGDGVEYNKPIEDIGNVGNLSPFVFVS
jgi:hypothetical protein